MSLLEATLLGSEAEVAVVPPPTTSALENGFPAAEISCIAENESWRKEVHRPATATHKWWAKRLGSVFRAILAAAVTDSEQAALDAYSGAVDLSGLTVLDPFSGSGTTLVEATKLGARPLAFDINPVATLVERQAIACWDPAELRRGSSVLKPPVGRRSTACTAPNPVRRCSTTSGSPWPIAPTAARQRGCSPHRSSPSTLTRAGTPQPMPCAQSVSM